MCYSVGPRHEKSIALSKDIVSDSEQQQKTPDPSVRFFLRMAGCVLAYGWFTNQIRVGPLTNNGDFDPFWVAPHWTVLLIWLATIAAFWADGIGNTFASIIASFLIAFFGWLAVGLVEAFVSWLVTSNQLYYGHLISGRWFGRSCTNPSRGRADSQDRGNVTHGSRLPKVF